MHGGYWQPVKARFGAFTVAPAVTVNGVADFCSEGVQFGVLPEFGTNASASSVKFTAPDAEL